MDGCSVEDGDRVGGGDPVKTVGVPVRFWCEPDSLG